MNPITARPGPVAFETPPETGFQNPAALSRTVSRPPVSERPSGSTIREQEQLSERRAAVSALAAAAAANAASNAGGLGASAEEITFGASERVEQETHDEARDAREGQDVRVDALKRIETIEQMMRQLAGDQAFASIRQRAEQFASLWMQGRTSMAIDTLDSDAYGAAERQALLSLALRRLPSGAEAAQLEARLALLADDPEQEIRQLMRTAVAQKPTGAAQALVPGSPMWALLQSTPSLKQMVELDDAGLTRLAERSVLRSRMDTRLGGGQVVFLHVVLGRMARQAHQVGESGVRVMKTGACPGIDKPDEVRKTARWILEFSFATAPQGPLGRMGPVLKLSGGGLASARRQLQRELAILPEAVWLNGDTKQLVNAELSNANTADLTRLGLLDRTAGMQSGERLARRVEG